MKTGNKRGAFSDSQRADIVKHALKQNGFKKWAVLVMAYTGMRNNEIMQLTKGCIKQENGIDYIRVNREGGRSVKTGAGVRQVHSELAYNILEECGYDNDTLASLHIYICP